MDLRRVVGARRRGNIPYREEAHDIRVGSQMLPYLARVLSSVLTVVPVASLA
jgi:hypothetical protein